MLFNYCRNLDFETKPEYSYVKKGLKSILDSINGAAKPIFDWNTQRRIITNPVF